MSEPSSKTGREDRRKHVQSIQDAEYILEVRMRRTRYTSAVRDALAEDLLQVARGVPLRRSKHAGKGAGTAMARA